MRKFLVGIVCIWTCLHSVSDASSFVEAEQRVIQVTIVVTLPNGSPAAGLCVGVLSKSPSSFGRTNASGSCTVTASLPSDLNMCNVALMPTIDAYSNPRSREDWAKYELVTSSGSFNRFYPVAMQTGVTGYSLSIAGAPARGVSVRLVRSGQPIKFRAVHQHLISPLKCDGDGSALVVYGLRADANETVCLYTGDERVFVLETVAAAASTVTAAGDVECGPQTTGRPVKLRIEQAPSLCGTLERPEGRCMNLTLVRASDGAAFVCSVDGDGQTYMESDRRTMRLPPGTYYVCPGLLDGAGLSMKLYALVRNGRIPDLEAASATKVVVSSETREPLEVTISGPGTESILQAIE